MTSLDLFFPALRPAMAAIVIVSTGAAIGIPAAMWLHAMQTAAERAAVLALIADELFTAGRITAEKLAEFIAPTKKEEAA